MRKQVGDVDGDMGDIGFWTDGQLFNVRFRITDMHIEGYQPLPDSHPLCRVTRYTFLRGDEIFDNVTLISAFHARTGEPNDDDNGKSGYEREPGFIQFTQKHKKLQKLLVRKLKSEYGDKNVTWEHALSNGTQVDVARKVGDRLVYYEIKTYSSVRVSIREAMGQLLEYAHWGNEQGSVELIVVSDLDLGEGREYLRKLRNIYKMPINYQKLEIETQQLYPLEF